MSKSPKPPKLEKRFGALGCRKLFGVAKETIARNGAKACYARDFGLLRNASRSSIHIHFGVALLVFGASLTSGSLRHIDFFVEICYIRKEVGGHFKKRKKEEKSFLGVPAIEQIKRYNCRNTVISFLYSTHIRKILSK